MSSIIIISDVLVLRALFYDLFTHSMKYLLQTYYALGTIQTKVPALEELTLQWGWGAGNRAQ